MSADSHEHRFGELTDEEFEARKSELRAHFDQLYKDWPASQIDEVIESPSFKYARCDCGEWMVSLA